MDKLSHVLIPVMWANWLADWIVAAGAAEADTALPGCTLPQVQSVGSVHQCCLLYSSQHLKSEPIRLGNPQSIQKNNQALTVAG